MFGHQYSGVAFLLILLDLRLWNINCYLFSYFPVSAGQFPTCHNKGLSNNTSQLRAQHRVLWQCKECRLFVIITLKRSSDPSAFSAQCQKCVTTSLHHGAKSLLSRLLDTWHKRYDIWVFYGLALYCGNLTTLHHCLCTALDYENAYSTGFVTPLISHS